MRIFVLVAALALLTACSARADIGAPPTPPPISTPQPQVIVIQPAQAQPASDDSLTWLLFVGLLIIGCVVITTAFYFVGYRHGQSESSKPQPYSQGFINVQLSEAQWLEFQALQHYKLTQGRRDIEVRR